ncbi:calmodulin-binding protein 60 A [Lactuca sativa]|uniref:calmodulin-binding protein 60 A n=1 Tax=Lactuca sativa TaxID=4236 RepID=UPI000CD940A4|nr:calmodulin-binding protein 60 A [Lactuca sativa]
MAVINQQLDDDNNREAGGSTRSSIDEFARANASKEAEMEGVIRLYLENIWPTFHINLPSEDEKNHEAGGSTSSVDELAMVSTSTDRKAEMVIRICKETLWPMICAEINAKHQNILSMVKEKYGLDLMTGRTWNSGNTASTSGSPVFQFQFLNGISTPVSTSKNIEGKDDKPFVVALVDQSSGQIVTTGTEAATEIEIVVLEGDCNDFETENWTSYEFNNKIIREWKGKKVLQGNTFLKLKEGIVYVNKISFTHNSTWKGKRICRLGARSKDAIFGTRVKEAKTESFLVKDKRNFKYNKHEHPSSSDEVYRLHGINHRSDCFKHLIKANIKTVMDLRTLNAINPEKLKDILKVRPNDWKIIMDHAHKCKDDNGIYLYLNSRDDQNKHGVAFNVYGHLVGLVSDSLFLPLDELSNEKKADGEKIVVSASEQWREVVFFEDEASLINHLQPPTITTLNSFPYGDLNLVIPQKNNPTRLITTIESHRKSNFIVGVTPMGGQSSQNRKRLASEHAISNSPKKPRDETDDEDFMQYLNFSQSQAQKWKTSVWCVVGWISIFSKVRNPSTVTNGLCSPIQHVQI